MAWRDDILFDQVEYLREYKRRPYFPPTPGARPRPDPQLLFKKETWLYTVEFIQRQSGAGTVKVVRFNRRSPVATAAFDDINEGYRVFDEVWKASQEATRQVELEIERGERRRI